VKERDLNEKVDWRKRAEKGFLASGIDPADRRGHKNYYIDLLQKMALEELLSLRGDEIVLDFGCGSGRMAYWIAPRVKKVVGLEGTIEMIQLAERNRKAQNVEFILYDGIHFPVLPFPFDLILSVWVLQYMEGETLRKTVSALAQYLRNGGSLYLIEQASDNPRKNRPRVEEYLESFKESRLECLRYYPIRRARWWVLYLIRYGMIPKAWFHRIGLWELKKCRRGRGKISSYKDYLFLLRKI